MFSLKLLFIEQFDSEFKGKKYKMFTFVDPNSLTIIYGQDFEFKEPLKPGQFYTCSITVKGGKFKVTDIS